MGLCLKASKAESRLDEQRYRVRPASGWSPLSYREICSSQPSGWGARIWTRAKGTRECLDKQSRTPLSLIENPQMLMCRTESSADDLRTGQGVVGGRAASSLRSAKTSPYQGWRFRHAPGWRNPTQSLALLCLVVVERFVKR